MTQTMTKPAQKSTVVIEWTNAPLIRMSANVDMPEYGIKVDQTFYLSRSSKNDGSYYIAVWSYDLCKWQCRCKATKPCRHEKAINADCKRMAAARRAAKLERAARLAAQKAVASEIENERNAEEAEQEAEVAEVLAELDATEPAAEMVETVNAELAKVGADRATAEEVAATQARLLQPNDTDQVRYFLQLNRRAAALKSVPTPTIRNVSQSWLLNGHSGNGTFSGPAA